MTYLLNRPLLKNDESLASYICRLEIANYYPGDFLKKIIKSTFKNFPYTPNTLEGFIRLSEITKVSFEKLYSASSHNYWQNNIHFIPRKYIFNDKNYYFHRPLEMNNYFDPETRNNYCPQCLLENGAIYKNSWSSKFNLLCIEHKIFLLKGCQFCGGSLSIMHLIKNQCPECKEKLDSCKKNIQNANDKEIKLEKKFQNLFFEGTKYAEMFSVPKPFVCYKPIHEIFIKFYNYLILLIDSIDERIGAQEKKYWAINESFKLLENWPYGYFIFLLLTLNGSYTKNYKFIFSLPYDKISIKNPKSINRFDVTLAYLRYFYSELTEEKFNFLLDEKNKRLIEFFENKTVFSVSDFFSLLDKEIYCNFFSSI